MKYLWVISIDKMPLWPFWKWMTMLRLLNQRLFEKDWNILAVFNESPPILSPLKNFVEELSCKLQKIRPLLKKRISVHNLKVVFFYIFYNLVLQENNYLWGRSPNKKYYELNDKNERDIANDLEKMINDLSGNGLLFSKNPSELDKETRELLIKYNRFI